METDRIPGPPDGRNVLMFGGKGGVGKTTCTAATALHYARQGHNTLVISTDATPSLSHIFETNGQNRITRVEDRLFFSELGQDEIREMWDRKFGHEVHDVFSSFVAINYADFTEFMTSVLPGLGDEFIVDFTRELWLSGQYDTIIWDTAPMGQTLALLKTPSLLTRHLRMAPRIYSRLKVGARSREPVLNILRRWEQLSAENMEFLRRRVKVTLVAIAEALAVEQLDGILGELNDGGIETQRIVINNLIKDESSEFLRVKAGQQKRYLEVVRQKCARLEIVEVPLFPLEIKGLDRLERVANVLFPADQGQVRSIGRQRGD
jgi:arsenite-transporting ATPase